MFRPRLEDAVKAQPDPMAMCPKTHTDIRGLGYRTRSSPAVLRKCLKAMGPRTCRFRRNSPTASPSGSAARKSRLAPDSAFRGLVDRPLVPRDFDFVRLSRRV